MPHGQPPIPPPRRQHDIPYSTGPPNIPSPPAYMGFPPQMNGHPPPPPPPYPAQQYPHWYPTYPPVQLAPRPYQQPYGPVIVSSYPHSQPIMAPAHMPSSTLPLHPGVSTPVQPPMSPPVAQAPAPVNIQEHPRMPVPMHFPTSPTMSSPPQPGPGPGPSPMKPFRAPVSPIYLFISGVNPDS